jgi:integrase
VLEQRIIPYFDSRRILLGDIRPRNVKAFIVWLLEQEDQRRPGRKLSKESIRHHMAVLRAMLADATEDDVIRTNPASGVRVAVPEGDGRGRPYFEGKRAMTVVQLRALLEEIPPEWRAVLRVHGPYRPADRRDDRGPLGPRSGRERHARPPRPLAVRRRPGPRAQDAPRQARHPDLTAPSRTLARAGQRQPVRPRTRLHDQHRHARRPPQHLQPFRHTCASLLFAPEDRGGGGKNVKQVQAWLGHHSAAFTLHQCVHLVDAGMGEADFFDDLLGS